MNTYIIGRAVFDDLGYRQEDKYFTQSRLGTWTENKTEAIKFELHNAQVLLANFPDECFALKIA